MLHRIIPENVFEKIICKEKLMLHCYKLQLNDPPPLEESSLSDQTSEMEETRPQDPSLSSVSLTPDSLP